MHSAVMKAAFECHIGRISRYCRRRLCYAQSADEATRQIFLEFAERFDDPDSPEGDFETRVWLYRAANRVIGEHLHRTRRQRQIQMQSQHERTGAYPDASGTTGTIDALTLSAAIEQLPPSQQDVAALRFYEGLGTREIGEILGRGHRAVKAKLVKATMKLSQHLTQWLPK